MSGRPWYAFYPDKYARDTAHLTFVQDAAYRRLLDHYYQTEKPLAIKIEDVQRIARASSKEEKQAVSSALAEFFHLKSDGWHNDKADEELAKAANISSKRMQAANKRYCKPDANAPANAELMQAACTHINTTEQNNTQEPENQIRPPLTAAQPRRKPRFAIPADFPGESQRLFALKFWTDKGRLDLANSYPDQRDQFRDHHAKEPTRAADWPATWRTWVRNAPKFSKGDANGRPGRPTKSDNLRNGIAAFLAAGEPALATGDDHEGAPRPPNGAAGRDLPADGQRCLSDGVEIPDFLRRTR